MLSTLTEDIEYCKVRTDSLTAASVASPELFRCLRVFSCNPTVYLEAAGRICVVSSPPLLCFLVFLHVLYYSRRVQHAHGGRFCSVEGQSGVRLSELFFCRAERSGSHPGRIPRCMRRLRGVSERCWRCLRQGWSASSRLCSAAFRLHYNPRR